MPALADTLTSLLIALGIGLLIGIDRERRKGEGRTRAPAGIRTFSIASVLGAVAHALGGEMLLAAAALAVAGLTALAYAERDRDDPGLTTEIALVLTVLLGGLAMREPELAAAAAVATAILLAARTPIHRFVRDVLTTSELRSLLTFAAASLIVLPLMPDRFMGPLDALNPRALWIVVILILGIGGLGYVAVRTLGARQGLAVAGFVSGFVSSSATIAAMGARTKMSPELTAPATAGAVLSTIATIVQTALLLAAVSPPALVVLGLPLALAGTAALAYGALVVTGSSLSPLSAAITDEPGEAFSLTTALALAATFAIVLVVAAAATRWLGPQGLALAATLAGFADGHAGAVSAAAQVKAGTLPARDAAVPVLAALSANAGTKIMLAVTSGTAAFAWRVVPGILLVMVAAWAGLLV